MKESTSTISLCGDVMIGRGIDQILPHPGAPQIWEPYMKDARGYLRLAELESGQIQIPVEFAYPWGDALSVWNKMAPQLRIINLETSITRSEEYWKGKGINYRMHPANLPCLTEAGIDCCTLANNHLLDWGYSGLEETLATLHGAGIHTAGAGLNQAEASAPALLTMPGKGNLHLFSCGMESSGIPREWGATPAKPGINLLPDLSYPTLVRVAMQIKGVKTDGDLAVVSLHWGGNWEFEITPDQRQFAHWLIDEAAVDIVYGHSSHHVKGIEIYHDKLVIYGCGDFINDYEGIRGFEHYRGELGLMYFAALEVGTGKLARLTMIPTRVRKFRVQLATPPETAWLRGTLNREGKRLGTCVRVLEDGVLLLKKL